MLFQRRCAWVSPEVFFPMGFLRLFDGPVVAQDVWRLLLRRDRSMVLVAEIRPRCTPRGCERSYGS